MEPNATFHAFKDTGKWYASGRGVLPAEAFHGSLDRPERYALILKANGEKFPGLSSTGRHFIAVIIPDESIEFGWPLLFHPSEV